MKKLREKVLDGLTAAYAADALPVDEYERRVQLVARSSDPAEIESAAADLPAEFRPAVPARPEVRRPGSASAAAPRGEIVAVFATIERAGRWSPPADLEASAVFGSAFIDFREADLPPGGIRLEANAVFGSMVVVVPEDVNVRVRSAAVFGSASGASDRYVGESAPTLDIEANAVFGNCDIKVARPGERVAGAPQPSLDARGRDYR